MSNPVILVPPFTHVPENTSTATSESGLTVASATEDSTNRGTLRIGTAGTPLSNLSLHVKLTSGGNARGYPSGVGFAWRNASEADTAYRYYTDAYVLRERFVASYAAANAEGVPSTPRQTADGRVGYPAKQKAASDPLVWYSVNAEGNATRATIQSSYTGSFSSRLQDSVVLATGRVLVFVYVNGEKGVRQYFSDDNGATWEFACLVGGVRVSGTDPDVLCAEIVGDTVFLLFGGTSPPAYGSSSSAAYWSFDGGYTFTEVSSDDFDYNPRTCVTQAGTVLIAEANTVSGSSVKIYEAAPGGSPVQIGSASIGCGKAEVAVATRDDGSVWLWSVGGTPATGSDALRMGVVVSSDGGKTWGSPSEDTDTYCWDLVQTSASTPGLRCLAAGPASGTVFLLGQFIASGLVEKSTVMWSAGGYENLGEFNQKPYSSTYSPVDVPNNLGWTRTDFSAGAAVTLDGPLVIEPSPAGNTRYRSSVTWWSSGTTTSGKRIRMTINASGGSVASDILTTAFSLKDGAGFTYGCSVRFSASQALILNSAGATLATVNYSAGWKTWVFYLRINGANLSVSAWIADANSVDGTALFTQVLTGGNSPRVAGTTDRMDFGGTALGFGTLQVRGIHVSNQNEAITPTGRFLPSAYAVWVKDFVRVYGVNAYGIPGDVYYVTTTYTYGKDNTWAEYRPSRYVQSSADRTPWRIVFDAGSDRFSADRVALLGTNFRTARFEMNGSDSWASPAVSVPLDATEVVFNTFTGGAGFIFLYNLAGVTLRPHQYRSDGDGHRWFLEVDPNFGPVLGPNVYEITDNDASRIYCQGVNLLSASGPARIFRDRMGAAFTVGTYRYASVVIDTQDTADDGYRLGTPVFGRGYQLPQSYDYGFVDRTEANVSLTTTPAGYRAAARLGPRRHTLAVQWSPINRRDPSRGDTDRVLAETFAALEGSRTPFVFWRDGDTGNDCGLVRVLGTLSRTNVWGEAATALTRVDQVTLEEEL